ncbi:MULTISPECIES: extracellular solute-binding protein [unclassified Streptosporangium]|uniref:extracellular solute-binding protein n=1 Tax=unclassified Streptosporangium TaxID=2632669 RepID=UPI002E2C7405|nr:MULTISPECIES: extracellular solute-binding protein [unclassified Streptosporangium]
MSRPSPSTPSSPPSPSTSGGTGGRGTPSGAEPVGHGVLLLLLLLACLPSLAASAAPTPPPGPPRDDCVLRIASGADVSGGARERALEAVWNGVKGRPRACFVAISSVADEQRSAMISAAQAKTGHYDVYNLDIQWIPEFAEEGYLRPIDSAAHGGTNDFLSQIWSAGAWNGVQYAVPFNTDVGLLYYRDDLRVPAGWQDMTGLAKARRAGPDPTALGLAGQFASYEGLTVNALEAIWANGGDVVDPDGHVVITRKESVEAVGRLIETVRAGVISGETLGSTEAESLTAFRERHALFLRHWPYAHEVLSGERRSGGIAFRAAPLPWQGVLGGQYLAVSRHTPRRDVAQRLVAALTGGKAAGLLYHCGGFAPARVSALYTEAGTGCGGPAPAATSPKPTSGSKPGSAPSPTAEPESEGVRPDTLLRALTQARARPPSPYYSEFSRVFRTEVHELLGCWSLGRKGCEDAKTFTAGLAPKLRKALAGG